jgi:cytochrome c oxidase subunit 1
MAEEFMNQNPLRRAFLFLVVAGAIGYGIGLGVDFGVTAALNFSGSVASAFALLFGFTAFFFGLYGYRGITRGLVWQVAGTLIGALLISGIRAVTGAAPIFGTFLFSEPAWVFGGLVGVVSFIAGVGIIDDWFKWARGIDTSEHHEDEPGWQKYFSVSLDHKVIGIQYSVTALFLIAIGGTFALIFRTELAASELQFLTTTFRLFNQTGPQATRLSLHGIIMIGRFAGRGLSTTRCRSSPAHDMASLIECIRHWRPAILLLMSLVLAGLIMAGRYPRFRAPGINVFLGVFTAGWSSIRRFNDRDGAPHVQRHAMPIFVWASITSITRDATQLIGLSSFR